METLTIHPDVQAKFSRPLMLGQIIEAFPEEAAELVPGKIKELREELKPFFDFIAKIRYSRASEDFKDFWIQVCKEIYMPKKQAEHLANLKIMQRLMSQSIKGITEADIMAAKSVSIWDLHSFEKRKKSTACCPFHKDTNASFGVRANRWNCFAGCGKGDAIDFYMKLHHVPFHTAIQDLMRI